MIRGGEQQHAAGLLGVREVVMLHYPDGELEDTKEFRKEIVRQIRRVQPEVVLCPEPYRKNLAWHRDNRISRTGDPGCCVSLRPGPPATSWNSGSRRAWSPTRQARSFFGGPNNLTPTSISATLIGAKVKAVLAHQSQNGNPYRGGGRGVCQRVGRQRWRRPRTTSTRRLSAK